MMCSDFRMRQAQRQSRGRRCQLKDHTAQHIGSRAPFPHLKTHCCDCADCVARLSTLSPVQ